MEQTTQPGAIYGKIADILAGIGTVSKSRRNEQQGYTFRGIDQFLNALHPLLAEHRVFIRPRVISHTQEDRESAAKKTLIYTYLHVEFDFVTDDGSYVTVSTYGEGMDSGDKSTNKAMSAALKYALMFTFAVPTEELEDGDADSPEIGKRKPPARQADPVREERIEALRDALHDANLHTADAVEFLRSVNKLGSDQTFWQVRDGVLLGAFNRPESFVNSVRAFVVERDAATGGDDDGPPPPTPDKPAPKREEEQSDLPF